MLMLTMNRVFAAFTVGDALWETNKTSVTHPDETLLDALYE